MKSPFLVVLFSIVLLGTASSAFAADPVLTSVQLTHGGLEIGTATPVGATANFRATLLDQNGGLFSGTTTVAWSSDNTAMATIDANGLMTAISPGNVTISATAVSGATSVTGTSIIDIVSAPVLSSVSIFMQTTTLSTGSWTNAIAQPVDQFATPSRATITWSSNNSAVATVNGGGKVTAVSLGTATITVTAVNGSVSVIGTKTVTVIPPPSYLVSAIETPATSSIVVGGTTQLTATPLDQSGVPFTGPVITWISNDTSIATVGVNGLVTGVALGTTTIYASVNQTFSTYAVVVGTSGTVITVAAPPIIPVASIAITPTSSTVAVGSTTQIVASAFDQNTSPLVPQPILTWSSDNPSTASVDTNGLVTGIASGTAAITASSGGIVSSSSAITVIAPAPVLPSVTVTPSSTLPLDTSSSSPVSLTVNVRSGDGPATSTDFILTVTQNGTTTYAGPAVSQSFNSFTVGDTYTVTEATTTASSFYAIALDPACSGTIQSTSTVICNIVNTNMQTTPVSAGVASTGGDISTQSGSKGVIEYGSVGGGGGGGGGGSGVIYGLSINNSTTTDVPKVSLSATSGIVLGASVFNFTRNLSLGARGSDVVELQKALIGMGFYTGPVTGYFGPMTKKAVIAYQYKYGIPSTGFVGLITRKKLNDANNGQVLGMDTIATTTMQAQILALHAQLNILLQQLAKKQTVLE